MFDSINTSFAWYQRMLILTLSEKTQVKSKLLTQGMCIGLLVDSFAHFKQLKTFIKEQTKLQ